MQTVNERNCRFRNETFGFKYLLRGPRIDWGIFRFPPGKEMGAHYHNKVEETFYFTLGSGRMIVGGREERIEAGDVYRIEPGEVHNFWSDGPEDLEGVFIKSIFDPDDKVDVK